MFIYICKHCARSFVLEIRHLVTVKLREKIVLTLLSVRRYILQNTVFSRRISVENVTDSYSG